MISSRSFSDNTMSTLMGASSHVQSRMRFLSWILPIGAGRKRLSVTSSPTPPWASDGTERVTWLAGYIPTSTYRPTCDLALSRLIVRRLDCSFSYCSVCLL